MSYDHRKSRRHKGTPPGAPGPLQKLGLSDKTTLTINDKIYRFSSNDLVTLVELGRGANGIVYIMKHNESDIEMAVKRIVVTPNSTEQKRLLMDLDVSLRLSDYPYTIHYYGALYVEGDVWICTELMKTSLDKFYSIVKEKQLTIPENVLGRICFCVVSALEYLNTQLAIIHRDVKPSNILLNENGVIKLCDFGISAQLPGSLAKMRSTACKPYMAPERINPEIDGIVEYDIRSDVWSLGITIVELAHLQFPYNKWTTPFDRLKAVVEEPSPTVPRELGYSDEMHNFIGLCLKKDYKQRPKYKELLDTPFLRRHAQTEESEVICFAKPILELLN